MRGTYYDGWANYNDLKNIYGDETPNESEIIYAGYTYESYEGAALVVFVRDGIWYENNDSHCSCYGLEHWAPEVTDPDVLLMRLNWPGLHEAIRAFQLLPEGQPMEVHTRYSATVLERESGNEVLFWQAVAAAVANMAPYITGHVSVSFHGEDGNRTARLSGDHREQVKVAAFLATQEHQ